MRSSDEEYLRKIHRIIRKYELISEETDGQLSEMDIRTLERMDDVPVSEYEQNTELVDKKIEKLGLHDFTLDEIKEDIFIVPPDQLGATEPKHDRAYEEFIVNVSNILLSGKKNISITSSEERSSISGESDFDNDVIFFEVKSNSNTFNKVKNNQTHEETQRQRGIQANATSDTQCKVSSFKSDVNSSKPCSSNNETPICYKNSGMETSKLHSPLPYTGIPVDEMFSFIQFDSPKIQRHSFSTSRCSFIEDASSSEDLSTECYTSPGIKSSKMDLQRKSEKYFCLSPRKMFSESTFNIVSDYDFLDESENVKQHFSLGSSENFSCNNKSTKIASKSATPPQKLSERNRKKFTRSCSKLRDVSNSSSSTEILHSKTVQPKKMTVKKRNAKEIEPNAKRKIITGSSADFNGLCSPVRRLKLHSPNRKTSSNFLEVSLLGYRQSRSSQSELEENCQPHSSSTRVDCNRLEVTEKRKGLKSRENFKKKSLEMDIFDSPNFAI